MAKPTASFLIPYNMPAFSTSGQVYNIYYNTPSVASSFGKPTNGSDFIYLDSKNDTVRALSGNDSIFGQGGNDTLYGDAGNDLISGGTGNDTLYGGTGHDTLWADSGNDKLYGGEGDDTLNSGRGTDTLYGDAGNDTLYADDYGNTTLYGGAGSDEFIFMFSGAGSETGDRDTIRDFTANDSINVAFLLGINDRSDLLITYNTSQKAYIVQDNQADDLYITVYSDHRLTSDDFIF